MSRYSPPTHFSPPLQEAPAAAAQHSKEPTLPGGPAPTEQRSSASLAAATAGPVARPSRSRAGSLASPSAASLGGSSAPGTVIWQAQEAPPELWAPQQAGGSSGKSSVTLFLTAEEEPVAAAPAAGGRPASLPHAASSPQAQAQPPALALPLADLGELVSRSVGGAVQEAVQDIRCCGALPLRRGQRQFAACINPG